MGKYGEPAEFRVNGKVNLDKSTCKKDKAGVCMKSEMFRGDGKVNLSKRTDIKGKVGVCVEPVNVEKAHSNKKQLRKSRHTFRKLFVAIIDTLDTMYSSFFEMRKDYLAFVVPAMVVLLLIALCLLSMWLSNLYGEIGRDWAVIILFIFISINAIMPFIVHAINSVLHKDENRG